MKIKLSDYVARFIASCGVDTVFAISGGASLHLIHSIESHTDIQLVCPHHEQAAAMAADGYARVNRTIGVAVATSGPGATNLVTGICCSFYDSVPVLFLTGQVSTFRSVGETKVRQIGFQETPIVEICRPITKYSVLLTDPNRIRYELEKAVAIMQSGRSGPVLVDIPDNLQRELIEEDELIGFEGLAVPSLRFNSLDDAKENIISALKQAKRPIVIAGWGIHLAGVEKQFREFVEALNIPVAFTWGSADLLSDEHPLSLGRFGTHGMRHTNFAVQNADLVLSLGSRLDTKATGSPINSFARKAIKIVVDIDPNELSKFEKFELNINLLVECDLRDFFLAFQSNNSLLTMCDTKEWLTCNKIWREVFDTFDEPRLSSAANVNPYRFFEQLSLFADQNSTIVVDTGCSIAWSMQAWRFKGSQRLFHDFNNTAMGWALPASIGIWFANGCKGPIICVVGDGSFMMSLQELATVRQHNIPIKIILINNSGYAMIRQTQDQWFESNHIASSAKKDLFFPDFKLISSSFGLDYMAIVSDNDIVNELHAGLKSSTSILIDVIIDYDSSVIPQVKFGRPNEDMEPLLPREIFSKYMLIQE
jgi:acetolactate synthase-1/2/3 large subunit